MTKINQPSKERVRKWLFDRQDARKPLPDGVQIRRQLEWKMSAQSAPDDLASVSELVCNIAGG